MFRRSIPVAVLTLKTVDRNSPSGPKPTLSRQEVEEGHGTVTIDKMVVPLSSPETKSVKYKLIVSAVLIQIRR